MKKQILILICTALLLLLLGGCKAEQATQSEQTEQTESSSADAQIVFSGSSASVTGSGASAEGGVVTITAAGSYVLSGSGEGRVLVNAPKAEVALILQNLDLTCSYGSPLYIYKAGTVTLSLPDGTQSTLTDGESYTFADSLSSETDEEPNACLYSKADLVISGSGSLSVNANYKNGVTSKDTLLIQDASLTVTAKNHGINGKDSCTVENASLTVTAGGDALRSTNDSDSTLGYIDITNSTLNLTAGEDGIQAETTLTVHSGSFTVTTGGGSGESLADDASAKGLKAGTQLSIEGGSFTLDCADDALHSNGSLNVSGGEFAIATGDDGMHADEATSVSGGVIRITECYEGIEGATVDISGGEIHIVASDDGINAAGGKDQSGFGPRMDSFGGSSEYTITISGGVIYVDASGDGVDSNGDLIVTGGELYIDGPTSEGDGALDYDGSGTITGGTVVAVGSNGMAMNFGSASTQGSILLNLSGSAGQTVTVKDASGNVILTYTPAKDYRSVVVSSPELKQGESYTVSAGGQETTVTLDSLIYGGGMGGNPGGQGGPGNMGGQPGGQGGQPGTPPDGNSGDAPTPPDGNSGNAPTPPDGNSGNAPTPPDGGSGGFPGSSSGSTGETQP